MADARARTRPVVSPVCLVLLTARVVSFLPNYDEALTTHDTALRRAYRHTTPDVSHGELVVAAARVPRELLPVSPLVERLQQRDAAVDRRLGVEEEHLGEDLVGAVGGG